jgi:murein DD-endopeptidase MepM/ murein hydrolase activator NlpD
MRVRGTVRGFRTLSRVALLGMIGGSVAACSSDSSRLNSPFTNPFSEPAATGSLPDEDPKPVAPLRTGRIQSESLAAPGAPRPAPMATALPPPAAATPARVASVGSSGWGAQGGTRITVSKNDSLAQMAQRYGVPASAILQANGLTSASQVTPGRELVIPAYNAVSGLNPAAASMTARPARAVEEKREDAKALEAKAQDAKAEAKRAAAKEAAVKEAAARDAAVKEAAAKEAAAKEAKELAARKLAEAKAAEEKARKLASTKEAEKKAHIRPGQTAKAADAKVEAKAESKADKARDEAKNAAKAEAVQKLAEAKAAREAAKEAAKESAKLAAAEKTAKAKADAAKAEAKAATAKTEVAKVEPVKAEPAKPEPAATGSVAAQASSDNFRWPAKGRVIAGYGASGNEGINIALPEGTPVKAAEDGTVAYAGSDVKGYGKLVLVRHSNGFVSAYAHNGELDVKPGDKVKRGQTIAKSGASGNVTSPQLHFEIRKSGAPVDPMSQLASN